MVQNVRTCIAFHVKVENLTLPCERCRTTITSTTATVSPGTGAALITSPTFTGPANVTLLPLLLLLLLLL